MWSTRANCAAAGLLETELSMPPRFAPCCSPIRTTFSQPRPSYRRRGKLVNVLRPSRTTSSCQSEPLFSLSYLFAVPVPGNCPRVRDTERATKVKLHPSSKFLPLCQPLLSLSPVRNSSPLDQSPPPCRLLLQAGAVQNGLSHSRTLPTASSRPATTRTAKWSLKSSRRSSSSRSRLERSIRLTGTMCSSSRLGQEEGRWEDQAL